MWLDSKAVNCPQKWGNFRSSIVSVWASIEASKQDSKRKLRPLRT